LKLPPVVPPAAALAEVDEAELDPVLEPQAATQSAVIATVSAMAERRRARR